MAKRNNRPWPENLFFDFNLPSTTDTEEFINSLSTSDKNKEFLRQRYKEGKQYSEIASAYGISPSAVAQAIKYVKDRYLKYSSSDDVDLLSLDVGNTASAEMPTDDQNSTHHQSITEPEPSDVVAKSCSESVYAYKPREELKPIITAIGTTTRQRTFVYDSKARVVISSNQIPGGLRSDSRFILLPDYYQIREYDLMQEFASSLADPAKSEILTVALSGLGPFKAFKSTVKEIGLNQAWADFRYQKFSEIAEEWWEREVVSSPPRAAEDSDSGVLIVEPNDLNGAALIETIRVLYHRVGAENFEAALDELRDAVCSISAATAREA